MENIYYNFFSRYLNSIHDLCKFPIEYIYANDNYY